MQTQGTVLIKKHSSIKPAILTRSFTPTSATMHTLDYKLNKTTLPVSQNKHQLRNVIAQPQSCKDQF